MNVPSMGCAFRQRVLSVVVGRYVSSTGGVLLMGRGEGISGLRWVVRRTL